MPSIELSKLHGIGAARSLSGSDRSQVEARPSRRASTDHSGGAPGVKLEVGAAIEAGKPPVNNERVAEVRSALKDGSYPLVPTRIADAMIAARYSFEAEQ